jgi:peptidyl-dipeptidase A
LSFSHQTAAILAYAAYRQEQYNTNFKDAITYSDEDINRKLQFLKDIGTSILPSADLEILTTTRTSMSNIYNSAKICPYDKQVCDTATEGWKLDPDMELALASSTDFEEQKYIWEQWREVSGKLMRDQYKVYIEKYNQAAALNEYNDAGEMWRSRYEEKRLVEIVDELWAEVEPLYTELHTYVRYKLIELYGDKMDKTDDLIPAHLLGNMWYVWDSLKCLHFSIKKFLEFLKLSTGLKTGFISTTESSHSRTHRRSMSPRRWRKTT